VYVILGGQLAAVSLCRGVMRTRRDALVSPLPLLRPSLVRVATAAPLLPHGPLSPCHIHTSIASFSCTSGAGLEAASHGSVTAAVDLHASPPSADARTAAANHSSPRVNIDVEQYSRRLWSLYSKIVPPLPKRSPDAKGQASTASLLRLQANTQRRSSVHFHDASDPNVADVLFELRRLRRALQSADSPFADPTVPVQV
jgi:hypothetical protein